jgi:phospholipid/cholesterol/gamma-HCH transport system substrate-binding protein/paraquat-inducible protein B
MRAEVRYFRVGLFVFLGLVLIVGALLVLGGQSFLEEPVVFETVFDEAGQGLEIGSPVKLRGVKIGQVAEIGLIGEYYDLESEAAGEQLVLVRFEALPEDLPEQVDEETRRHNLEAMIARGLRLRLTPMGITGTSFVEADFVDPEKNPPTEISWTPEALYIPSTPSTLTRISSAAERVMERLDELEIEEMVDNVNALLVSLNDAVEDLEFKKLRREGEGLVTELRRTVAELRTALRRTDLPAVGANLRETLESANATLAGVRQSLDGGRYDLELALENLRVTSENLRDLTDTLRDQPSLLIRGGPPQESGGGGP